MWRYVLKRVALAAVTMVIILSLTFILMKLLPFQRPVGNEKTMLAYYLSQTQKGYVADFRAPKNDYGELLWQYVDTSNKKHFFYQTPVMQQYFAWLKGIFTEWDWGTSTYISPNVSAISIIGERLPTTISINILSVIVSVPLGIALGIWAALKKNKPTDHIISTSVMIFISIPSLVLITILMWISVIIYSGCQLNGLLHLRLVRKKRWVLFCR